MSWQYSPWLLQLPILRVVQTRRLEAAMPETTVITGYHAHVYFGDDADSREKAARVREAISDRFTVVMGRWHDMPVGPHPTPMYQVAFETDQFATLVPWLMLNREGLTVLVHPNTDDAVADHRDLPMWMGDILPMNLAVLEK
jgi:aromatic ring-cleaving dioxygenase